MICLIIVHSVSVHGETDVRAAQSSRDRGRERQAEWNLTVCFTGGGRGGLSCSRSLLWGSFIGHMWLGCQIRRHDYTLALFVCVHACSCMCACSDRDVR